MNNQKGSSTIAAIRGRTCQTLCCSEVTSVKTGKGNTEFNKQCEKCLLVHRATNHLSKLGNQKKQRDKDIKVADYDNLSAKYIKAMEENAMLRASISGG